jgi:hypothetical protein
MLKSRLQSGFEFLHSTGGKIVENRSYMLDVKWDVVLTLGNQNDGLPKGVSDS